MKAYVMHRHGGPDALQWHENYPDPQPGPGEVIVEVGAAGLNNTDIWTREGAYGSDDDSDSTQGWTEGGIAFPRIQGGDVAGKIVGIGEGVPKERVGERVLVNATFYDGAGEMVGVLGSELDGGFAEFCKVLSENAIKIESTLSDIELASFPIAYHTAEGMLRRAGVCDQDTLLVTGASGGLGSALIQLAKLRGAHVIAIAGAAKSNQVKALGASAIIPRGDAHLNSSIKDALAGRPLNVVADVVGGTDFSTLIGALAPNGRYVVAGAMGGPVVELDLRRLYLKVLTFFGSTMGNADDFRNLVRHIESGGVDPLVAAHYPLKQLLVAQDRFHKKDFVGKLVAQVK